MSQFIPNSFQVPNAVVDELMDDLKDVEFRCYITLIRQTTGWNKQFDFISVSQFQKFTGRGKTAIVAAMKNLQNLGLVVELEQTKNGVKCYALNMGKLTEWGSESEPQGVQKVNGSKSELVQKVNGGGSESEPQGVQKVNGSKSELVQKVNGGGSESEPQGVQKVNTQNTNNKTHSTKHNITRIDSTENNFPSCELSEADTQTLPTKKTKSQTEKKSKQDVKILLAEFGIVGELADDYIAHRKMKRADISPTVLKRLATEAEKVNLTPAQAAEYQIAQGWTGFSADWILNRMGFKNEKTQAKSDINTVSQHDGWGFKQW